MFSKRNGAPFALAILTLAVIAALTAVPAFAASTVSGPVGAVREAIAEPAPAQAKYVFVFIGDGMGVPQRTAAELYLAAVTNPGARPEQTKLVMNTLPVQGMNTTYDLTSVIPDSASTGTAIASGFKTASGVVNMDPAGKVKYESMAETAKKNGFRVGVISSVSIDHATPASFYAHQPSRNNYYDIALELSKSGFDYFGGGAMLQPTGSKKDQSSAVDAARAAGYTVVTSRAEFDGLAPGCGKVLAMNSILDKDQALNYEMDRVASDISLAEYTKKGIQLLDNPKGFFMAVEGGKVDWAAHANDGAAVINDVLAFDAAVAEAVSFYKQHPNETLIVVTGDHETGGMTIGFAGTQYDAYFTKIQNQKMSFLEFGKKLDEYKASHTADNADFNDIVPLIQDAFGLVVMSAEERADLSERAKTDKAAKELMGVVLSDYEVRTVQEAFMDSIKGTKFRDPSDHTYLLYGGYEPLAVKLTTILNQKSGIGWTTYSHTGVPVQTSAIGVGQEQFAGFYDQPDIYKRVMAVAAFK